MGIDVKNALRELKDVGIDTALDTIKDCSEPLELKMCTISGRAKSEYQVFIGNCMRSKPIKGKPFGEAAKYMKECAVEWRKVKGGRGNESKNR